MSPHFGSSARGKAATSARFLVLLLAFAWGTNWIGAAFALREVAPWSLRFAGLVIATMTLFVAAHLSGRKLAVSARQFKHIALAGFFNVGVFNMCSAFAQLSGATSRVIIVTYSMPIWSAALAWLVLGDRLRTVHIVALGLCIGGLAILVWPLFAGGLPVTVFYALGCALSWGGATVYLKWADIGVDPLANAAWQLLVGCVSVTAGMLVFDGYPRLWPISDTAIFAIFYIAVIGVALPHFLWWTIVSRLPTVTAALGSLLVPIVGITASAILLGERPTPTDFVGFVMIFAAAASVLLQPNVKLAEIPE